LPLCTLISCIKPSSALSNSHCIGWFSSIQWPVMAKYPFICSAYHTLHVMLTAPLTELLCNICQKTRTLKGLMICTFSFAFNQVKWFLNMCMISACVALQPGILTPHVAQEATSIISLNFGYSRACIGCHYVIRM
jgi:hypothetical protein